MNFPRVGHKKHNILGYASVIVCGTYFSSYGGIIDRIAGLLLHSKIAG